MSTLWSEKEVSLLKEIYSSSSWDYILSKIGRSRDGISIKANKLGLERNTKWTEDELDVLRDMYKTKPISYIMDKLGRSEDSIHVKANRLGLHKDDYFWRDEDTSLFLFLYYSGLYHKDIADIMNRTEISIRSKATKLNLSREHYLTIHGMRESRKQKLSVIRKQMMEDNPNFLMKMNEGAREYHRTHENTCPAGWNRGMKPWEWMNITKDEYYNNIVPKCFKFPKPTSIERRVIRLCEENNLPYKYVGDFKVWIDGRNPDFINCNGEKKLIELFGNYWHKPEDEKTLPDHYKMYGFKTLVIWENDMREQSDEDLIGLIKDF